MKSGYAGAGIKKCIIHCINYFLQANQNKENNQSITDLWRLEESILDDLPKVNKEAEPNIDIVTLDSPSILVSSRSR